MAMWVQDTVDALPELVVAVQVELLDLLSLCLAQRPFREDITPAHRHALLGALQHGDSHTLTGPRDCCCTLLVGSPHMRSACCQEPKPGKPLPEDRSTCISRSWRAGELHGTPLTRLALETLGSFHFGPISLLEFVRDHVIGYLDEAEVSIRKAAALASARILNRHATEETHKAARHLVSALSARWTVVCVVCLELHVNSVMSSPLPNNPERPKKVY